MQPSLNDFIDACPEKIRAAFCEKRFKAGESILFQGDDPGYVYFLLEGQAGVYQLAENGVEFLAYVYRANEFFGEIEVLNQKPLLSNVRAELPCKTKRLDRENFLDWLQSDPAFNLFVCRQLAEKLYQAGLKTVDNLAYPLRRRVLDYLDDSRRNGQNSLKKADLVAALGSNERSINRILKDLAEEGVLECRRGTGLVQLTSVK